MTPRMRSPLPSVLPPLLAVLIFIAACATGGSNGPVATPGTTTIDLDLHNGTPRATPASANVDRGGEVRWQWVGTEDVESWEVDFPDGDPLTGWFKRSVHSRANPREPSGSGIRKGAAMRAYNYDITVTLTSGEDLDLDPEIVIVDPQ